MAGDRSQPSRPGTASDPHAQPGVVVADKYVVEEVLGAGAMGTVVSARHKLIGQRVAIKLISPDIVDSAAALARFTREARALAEVASDHVVRVVDYGTMPDDRPYLVMEYLTGRDLLKELRARGTLPLSEAAEIVLQACEGLTAVHARGIVHRDIKPANLFLTTRSNGKLLVKIVDFGISKGPKMTDEELSITQGSMAIGSPHYMSPEQLRDAKNVDARSDVWSLGVILHRVLTGVLPFEGETVGALMGAVIADEPRSVRDVRPELPREIEAIVGRCLQKKPDARYQSAAELADALTPFAMPSDRTPRRGDGPPPLHDGPSPANPDVTAGAHVSGVVSARGKPTWIPRAAVAGAIAIPLVIVFGAMSFGLTSDTASTTETNVAPLAANASKAASVASALVPGAHASARQGGAITDLPAPKTTNASAAAAYQSAIQAVRDASLIVALNAFRRAAVLDPSMAAAHLRVALYGDWQVGSDERARVQTAMALRASLDDRDRALLEMLEPLYLTPHPDQAEAKRRMDALVVAHPNDAEIAFVASWIFVNERPRQDELALCDRILAIDPKFAAAWWLKAMVAELTGDQAASLKSVEECLAVSPSAASCLRVRATIEEAQGDCAGLETDAQRMVTMESDSHRAHEFLARALFSRGRPLDAVREALQRKWRASPMAARKQIELVDTAHLAILRGDFAAAERNARELEQVVATNGTEAERSEAALLLIELHDEMGDPKGAAHIADAFLRRRGASPGSEHREADPRPQLYAAAVRGGARTAAEESEVRTEWLDLWNRQTPALERAGVWIDGYAAPAETREEAESALAALPEYAPVPTFLLGGWTAPALAKVYALAGRSRDALPELKVVTTSCRALDEPSVVTRAHLFLGQALETTGDTAGACAAYAQVIARWGKATPRSVTAEAAKARDKALACSH